MIPYIKPGLIIHVLIKSRFDAETVKEFIFIIIYSKHKFIIFFSLQKVLSSSKHVEKIYFYKLLHNFLGEGLVTSEGSKWRYHRKLIQPSFHISLLEEYVQIFDKGSQILIDVINNQIQINSPNVNVTPFINKCVVNILNGVQIDFLNKLIMQWSYIITTMLLLIFFYCRSDTRNSDRC